MCAPGSPKPLDLFRNHKANSNAWVLGVYPWPCNSSLIKSGEARVSTEFGSQELTPGDSDDVATGLLCTSLPSDSPITLIISTPWRPAQIRIRPPGLNQPLPVSRMLCTIVSPVLRKRKKGFAKQVWTTRILYIFGTAGEHPYLIVFMSLLVAVIFGRINYTYMIRIKSCVI